MTEWKDFRTTKPPEGVPVLVYGPVSYMSGYHHDPKWWHAVVLRRRIEKTYEWLDFDGIGGQEAELDIEPRYWTELPELPPIPADQVTAVRHGDVHE